MSMSKTELTSREIGKFTTSGGAVIYRLPVEAFRNHFTNCYLVLDDRVTLFDTGSGMEDSNKSLVQCFEALAEAHGEKVRLEDVGRVIVTHGHIDHFGGLNFVLSRTKAEVGIHRLDLSTVRNFHERLIVSSKNLQVFLARAGLSQKSVDDYVERNKWSKNVFESTGVDFTFEDGELIDGVYRIHHTPGHCPGQVCIGIDDVLLTADHVLSYTTPNQSPESIIRYNGLGHYFSALRKIRGLDQYRLGLGGHEAEMEDLPQRIDDIIAFHERRLEKAMEICATPKPISRIAKEMFPHAKDYHVLLALTEAGAHVEYLHERGELVVMNIEEVERQMNPVLYYQKAD